MKNNIIGEYYEFLIQTILTKGFVLIFIAPLGYINHKERGNE